MCNLIILDNECGGKNDPQIKNALQNTEIFRLKCYSERRQWQLGKFRMGYQENWSREELIIALKTKYSTLCTLQRQNPGATSTIMIPMIRAAYMSEITT